MRHVTHITFIMFVAALIATADSAAAQDVNAPQDTPEVRSRCLGLSYEVSAMMDQVEKEQDSAIKEAGANPTPEQTKKLKDLESEYVGLAYIWEDLADYFEDADAPSDDIKLDLALLTGEELSSELDVCEALIDQIDKASTAKAP
ncbi:hypothetical protein [Asticcacaulis benevestitus]|uniref:Lysozyme inhibitor LprI N-terminal domain-containing protein n=1 Tax=Asticcacaulis benevestitus DSM 16100 = ATCC BAA-896 TaxID=1121022 RepID=V4PNE2_9CAUL|nr:hypothetical protein [Asticcacaulis benevestitus]ESQ88809.1 hypothetical protein ABENE_14975 [Asticcacaulis benevestitus DSM 16100 = ATCC BAA-896]